VLRYAREKSIIHNDLKSTKSNIDYA